MSEAEPVLPIVQGDWVASRDHGSRPQIGRVRQSYWDREPGGEVIMDVVLFSPEGEKIGRESVPCGGPKSFEPACSFDDRWMRIEPPDFPLTRHAIQIPIPEKPGMVRLEYTYQAVDGGSGMAEKPVRTKVKKQSTDRPRSRVRVVMVPALPTNDANSQAAGLRRAAQELRDSARDLPGASADILRQRAAELDAEATQLSKPLSP